MSATVVGAPVAPRRLGRSVAAVVAGFLAVAILSGIADQVMHATGVFPPLGEPMFQLGLVALALSYRLVFTVLGGWVAARLAPSAPMRHALILGAIGLVAGTAAALGTMSLNLLPVWYLFALPATALPCAWLGGRLNQGRTLNVRRMG